MQNWIKDLKNEWEKKGWVFEDDLKAAEKTEQSLLHLQKVHTDSISEWLKNCKKSNN